MIKRKLKNKGFTLVELLAAILILGILISVAIVYLLRYINTARESHLIQQEKTIAIAAESYGQANTDILPKSIGETTTIPLSSLLGTNYLKETITNADGENCMEKSFVTIYKESATKYTYETHLYCGDEEVPKDEQKVIPTIAIDFTDDDNTSVKEDPTILTKVSEIKLSLRITGGVDVNGNKLDIDGYNYTILTSPDENTTPTEVYSSGTLSANHLPEITVEKPLKEYIDITGSTTVYVKVTVRNDDGGVNENTVVMNSDGTISDPSGGGSNNGGNNNGGNNNGGNNNGDDGNNPNGSGKDGASTGSGPVTGPITIKDTVAPTCAQVLTSVGENNWVNKKSSSQSRKITVSCEDGGGSGCIRDTFTVTWPNKNQKSAEYAYIQVEDNASNKSRPDTIVNADDLCTISDTDNNDGCRVRVNVDLESPTAIITAYKANSSGGVTGTNMFSDGKTRTVKDGSETATIAASSYKNLTNDWMNAASYADGVIYTVQVKDNLHLGSWKWETNPAYLTDTNNSSYTNYSLSNPDAASGTIDTGVIGNCGIREYTFNIPFKAEGKRKGKLTVTDKAGNEVVFYIEVNIDRTAPPIPAVTLKKFTSNAGTSVGDTYQAGTWSNLYVRATVADSYKNDNLSNSGRSSLSGWKNFEYEVRKAGVSESSNASEKAQKQTFDFTANYQGKNLVRFRSCDNAGNCSSYSNQYSVWVDTIAPACNVTATDNKGANYSGAWKKKGESVTVNAVCSENASNSASGCIESGANKLSYSKTYSTNINTTKAGANGDNVLVKVQDAAGNVTNCGYKTVKIDVEEPSCVYEGESTTWTNSDRTIKWNCKDTGGSACVALTNNTKKFTTTTKTWTQGSFTISDNAGNTATCGKTYNIYVDKTNPTCTKTGDSNVWTKNNRTIILGCNDNDSGCKTSSQSYTYSTTTKTDSKTYTITDNANNSVTCKQSFNVYVDKTPPSATVSGESTTWTNGNRTITLTCTDSESGCSATRLNNFDYKTSYGHTYTTDTTTATITDRFVDNAGNVNDSVTKTVNVYVDKGTNLKNSTGTLKDRKITVTAGSSLSGIKSITYAFNTKKETPSSFSSTRTGPSACGKTYYAYAQVTDNADNSYTFYVGSYSNASCCSESNPTGCNWVTSCREGNTAIYTTSSATTWAGTVQHHVGGKNDKLYVLGTSGNKTKVYAAGGDFYASAPKNHIVWIYSNCLGPVNRVCAYSQCPG